jgi:hypothetical protein
MRVLRVITVEGYEPPAVARSAAVTAADMVAGHVTLDVSCLDRLYLNCDVAKLQTAGRVGEKFCREVKDRTQANGISLPRFAAGNRTAEVMAPYLQAAAASGRSQVAAGGCAHDFQRVWTVRKRDTDPGGCPQFFFTKEQRRVSVFYAYIFR